MNILKRENVLKMLSISLIGFLSIIMTMYASNWNRFIAGGILFAIAVGLYFVIVFRIAEKNWLDIRAVFTGIWLGTIGLATLRLTNYQEVWLGKTWMLLAIAYVMFQLGATLGINNGERCSQFCKKGLKRIENGKLHFAMQEQRLFWICVITTLIGLVCFLINVAIRGYIPFFSTSTTAYIDFYTKFHVFAVAATAISGLCYYCIKTQPITLLQKVILWLCIFYLVILFPTFVVSRGVFIMAALALTTTIFYLNKKKLWVFIVCLIVMMGMYLFTSSLRGYTDAQLNAFFEPSEITVDNSNEEETTSDEITNSDDSFSLPPKVAFLYGYLTVSHDNFNEAVENAEEYTWGARQFYPFNVILRIPQITDMIENGEYYLVRPHLNTVNMIGLFYYDFHELGVLLCTLFWSLVFGLIQGFHMSTKGPFSLFILGFTMNAVALSFFSSWVDSFELWMFCGVIFIVAIVACTKVRKRD